MTSLAMTHAAARSNAGAGFFADLMDGLSRRRSYARTRASLERLSDASLADIGLERADIPAAAARAAYGADL
ncbi:MAG: DUF1127 domain-containing protein [Pseudomonadota bacterium]|nr:DUF1127 domain-containing protein [Pseudomonadota bacterium]MEE3098930.1 DUF1127 domain-containing protein [Pseudomonadota bacterium]